MDVVDVVPLEDVVVLDPRLPPLEDTLLVGDVCSAVEDLVSSGEDPLLRVPVVLDPESAAAAAGPDIPEEAEPVAEEAVVLPVLPEPDDEPPAASSACANPAPLTKAALNPRVTAPAPSQV